MYRPWNCPPVIALSASNSKSAILRVRRRPPQAWSTRTKKKGAPLHHSSCPYPQQQLGFLYQSLHGRARATVRLASCGARFSYNFFPLPLGRTKPPQLYTTRHIYQPFSYTYTHTSTYTTPTPTQKLYKGRASLVGCTLYALEVLLYTFRRRFFNSDIVGDPTSTNPHLRKPIFFPQ